MRRSPWCWTEWPRVREFSSERRSPENTCLFITVGFFWKASLKSLKDTGGFLKLQRADGCFSLQTWVSLMPPKESRLWRSAAACRRGEPWPTPSCRETATAWLTFTAGSGPKLTVRLRPTDRQLSGELQCDQSKEGGVSFLRLNPLTSLVSLFHQILNFRADKLQHLCKIRRWFSICTSCQKVFLLCLLSFALNKFNKNWWILLLIIVEVHVHSYLFI